MAELKADQRQTQLPSAPDVSGAGKAYGTIGKVAQGVAQTVVEHKVAADNLESSFLYAEGANSLNTFFVDAMDPVNIGNINEKDGTAIERYESNALQFIGDTVAAAPPSTAKEVELKLRNVANANSLKIRAAVRADVYAKGQASILSMIDGAFINLYDAARAGDFAKVKQTKQEIVDLSQKGKFANFLDDKKIAEIKLQIRAKENEATYFRMGEQAVEAPPGTASKIRDAFASSRQGLPPHEFDAAMQAFDHGVKQQEYLRAGEKAKRKDKLLTLLDQKQNEINEALKFGTQKDIDSLREEHKQLTEGLKSLEFMSEQEANRNETAVENAAINETTKREIDRIETEIAKKELIHEQFNRGGLTARAKEVEDELTALVQRLEHLRFISKKTEFEKNLNVKNKGVSQRYEQRGINDANAEPGAIEAQREEFARDFQDDELTHSQRIQAIQDYNKGATQTEGLLQGNRSITQAQITNEIALGTITNPTQLLGKGLTQLQYEQAKGQLITHQSKQNAQQAKVNYALQAIRAGAGAQDRLEPKDKEAAYGVMASELLRGRREETGNPDYQLDEQDQLLIAKQMNTDIPWLTSRLNYAALQADPETEGQLIAQTLAFARQLSEEAPNVLRKIDSKARAVLTSANNNILSSQGGSLPNIMAQTRAVVNPSDPEKIARSNRWTSLTDKDKKKLYKNVFPDDPSVNVDTFGQFTNKLSAYNMTSSTMDEAAENVRQEMEPVYGQDRFFEPGKVGYLPAKAAVPFSNVGQWYPNQVFINFYGLTQRQKSDPDLLPTDRLHWIYPDVPEKLNESALMHDNLHLLSEQVLGETEPTAQAHSTTPTLKAKWRGEIVDVFYEADGMSRIGDNDRVKYVFYLKDSGGNKFYIRDPKSKDGSGNWVEYPKSLPEFLPHEYASIDSRKQDDLIEKSYSFQRVYEKGTKKGPLAKIKLEKSKETERLTKSFEQYKEPKAEKAKKKSKPDLIAKLLDETS